MNSFCAVVGGRPPFTAAQWQELEHQALILKYLIAGVPVPPELIVPIRRSYEALAGRYYQSSMSYYSYYGKRPDPEPGRCRRTDGKKWRCSKDAYPGSKYCERHMHRGRNRSRKPVESQTVSPTQTTSSTSASHSPCGNNASGVRNFQNIALHSTAGPSDSSSPCLSVPNVSQLPLDTSTLSNRYFTGFKAGVDEHSFFSQASASERHLVVDPLADNSWRLSTPASIFPPCAQQHQSKELGQITLRSLPGQQSQQQSFGSDFSLTEPAKHETQFLRPFFDEWPNARDSWSDLDEDRSNPPASFSTTQLSISLPMTSPGFTSTSSRSPNED
ncbi:growth-regulating factor 4-like [Curcuma longa]|uniref:growth-regulating factor 4-like n=1 Tax=Curcuma longa TaxID=136217 RepID=UPI003D9E1D18